jgi:hypothetical protein
MIADAISASVPHLPSFPPAAKVSQQLFGIQSIRYELSALAHHLRESRLTGSINERHIVEVYQAPALVFLIALVAHRSPR